MALLALLVTLQSASPQPVQASAFRPGIAERTANGGITLFNGAAIIRPTAQNRLTGLRITEGTRSVTVQANYSIRHPANPNGPATCTTTITEFRFPITPERMRGYVNEYIDSVLPETVPGSRLRTALTEHPDGSISADATFMIDSGNSVFRRVVMFPRNGMAYQLSRFCGVMSRVNVNWSGVSQLMPVTIFSNAQ